MHLADVLEATVRSFPDAPAVHDTDGWLSYGELARLVARISARLSVRTAETPGSVPEHTTTAGGSYPPRVAIFAENGAFAVAAFFAAAAAGCVAVPLTPDLQGDRLAALLAHSEASAILVSSTLLSRVTAVRDAVPSLRLVLSDGSEHLTHGEPHDPAPPAARSPSTLAAIVYTSGSTGRPKGVMLTHEALVSNARSVAAYLGLTQADRTLLVLPLGYVLGLSVLITHVVAGASLVLQRRFLFASVVLDALQDHRCTGFFGVPATYALLLRSAQPAGPDPEGSVALSSLRYLAQAGGPLCPELQARICDAFPGATLYVMYGATEAGPRISYRIVDAPDRAGPSVGAPLPGAEIRVCDPDGTECSAGEAGEIRVRSPGLMLGYWRDAEATREVLRDGWYRTGDLGFLDQHGELTITGRARDFLKVRGHRVSPRAIEHELCEMDGVRDAAVIGVAHDLHGEVPVAYLVADDGAVEGVAEAVARRLPPWMRPVAYRRLESLPRTASGKVDRPALRAHHRAAESEAV